MSDQNKHILVTGGAGFLGSHLCERLLQLGHQVTCIDNFCTGSQSNINALLNHPLFDVVQHNIARPLPINFIVDEIYNLACPASPIQYQRDPVQTIKTCIHGAMNVLDLANELQCKIFQASTSEVYGDPTVHPQTESYWGNVNPIGKRSCYDEGKRSAESLFFNYHLQYNLPIKVGRIFNTYGPRMHPKDGRVVTNFIMQALNDQDITIYGNGEQTRSFCYVDDLIDGMINFMALPDNNIGPLNLGNPVETSVASLAKQIIHITHSSSNIIFKALPEDDPKQRCPDITLAKKLIGFEPTTSLQTGLKKTIDFLKESYCATSSLEI